MKCQICNRLLNQSSDPLSLDCGGDCWGCIGEIEANGGWEPSLEQVRKERAIGLRPEWIATQQSSSRPEAVFPHFALSSTATMLLHIIYTETAMFLSKKSYPSWRAIQDEFPDYKASFGPWEAESVIEYLQDDYPDLMPPAATQVAELVHSDSVLRQVTFLIRA